jgi:pimeloyl-ACP methyl ester carboxylesterase
LGSDRRVWDPLTRRLGEQRELIAVDLPGFGDSPRLQQTPTPAALAQAVGELIDELDLREPHVAGISLGGWVALELGLRGDVATVTAVAPAGLWQRELLLKPAWAHTVAGALSPLLGPVAATARGRRLLLTGSVAHPERVPAADATHLVRTWATAPGFNEVNAQMRAGRFTELAAIECPVTLVWPEHDRLIVRPQSLPRNVVSVELADAGHVPVWDAPDPLIEILLAATAVGARAA